MLRASHSLGKVLAEDEVDGTLHPHVVKQVVRIRTLFWGMSLSWELTRRWFVGFWKMHYRIGAVRLASWHTCTDRVTLATKQNPKMAV